jgi:hypothetical protein
MLKRASTATHCFFLESAGLRRVLLPIVGCMLLALAPPGAVAASVSDSSKPLHPPLQLPSTRIDASKGAGACNQARSLARAWNEQLLAAIRIDAPRPTVHARNLFHVSLAMYDVWAAFDPLAQPHQVDESIAAAGQGDGARDIALSYAVYRLLLNRFAGSPAQATAYANFASCMQALGLDTGNTTISGNSAAAIGNRVAAAIIAFGLQDGANQQGSYLDPVPFFPVNSPMLVSQPGTGGLVDVNAWQPLIPPGAPGVQSFLTSHWQDVVPFAIARSAPGVLYRDPGAPPKLGGVGDAIVKTDIVNLIRYSSQLTPLDSELINISPRLVGNNPLGTGSGSGHPINPTTGQPYPDNLVKRGDWSRVLSEFWADGPRSSTPPGHWNEIANEVSDHPATVQRLGGQGPLLGNLEWDVKLYFALNGALHDNAIATWEVKRGYGASRPITLIREMATLGQSSDPGASHYHPDGLPLEAGLIEVITTASSAPGERHAHLAGHLGEIAVRSWAGHPALPASQFGGVAWVLGESWLPYQQRNFVTPPFPGYTSGHSGFSRAAAEVLTAFTGSAYFPGGLGEARAATDGQGFQLAFEFGPSEPMSLQWATYYDAADEAGISRLYGGIHPAYDDFPGRVIGHHMGLAAIERARALFGASAAEAHSVPGPGVPLLLLLGLGLLLHGSQRLRGRAA